MVEQRAAPRAGERGDGRRRHRDLGVEILLPVLASGHRDPRSRSADRADGASATATRDPSATRPSPARRAGQQPGRAELHAAVPGLSVRPRRLRRGALPDPAQVLRDRRHPLHVRVRRVQRCDRDNEGVVRPLVPRSFSRSRRPRRRTARAGSTSASTGRSTRRRGSPRAGASRITCSRTRSCRCAEGRHADGRRGDRLRPASRRRRRRARAAARG